MDTNVNNVSNNANTNDNLCKNCGKKLPSSKFCMYCGCNNKEDALIEENKSKEVINEDSSKEEKTDVVNIGGFSSNKHLMAPMVGLFCSIILLEIGLLCGGFSGLFSGNVVADNSLSSDVKILSDNNKKIYYLENGKIKTFDGYVDKKEEEQVDVEKEKYFPSKKNSDFLEEINKNEIIDFDFTDATNEYINKMIFLSNDKLFVVDNGVIDTIPLTKEIKSNSAAVSYFNYIISSTTNLDSSKYISDKDFEYSDYDDSSYNEKIYVFDQNSKFSYYEKDGYFSKVDVVNHKIDVDDFNLKNKKIYYSDNGTFIFRDSKNIYMVNMHGLAYKNTGIVYNDMTISLMNIKHIFQYNKNKFCVVTNNGKIYDLTFNQTKSEFSVTNSDSDNKITSNNSNVLSLFKSISFKNLNFKDIIVLVILFGSFILLGANLYIKMYSNYFSKLVSCTLILGIALSIVLLLYLYSVLKFKDVIMLFIDSFGAGFIIANVFISFTDIISFSLNKIRVNILLNYILAFIMFVILLLVCLEYNLIIAFLLAVHIFWFVCVTNDISYNKTIKIDDNKTYYIVSGISFVIVVIGLILGYTFLPDVKKDSVILLLPYMLCLLSVLAPSIYLQKDFDLFMFLKMIFMGIFMYVTPTIISYFIKIFQVLGEIQEPGKVLGQYLKMIIIIIILIILIIILCTLVHVLTRTVVTFITNKIKMEGLVLQTILAVLFYIIFGVITITFGGPLINEITEFLFKLFFGEDMLGLLSFLL